MSSNFLNSSIGRKILMALSGVFLMVFLFQHFIINFLSIISSDLFNDVSHFMGTNFIIQFLLQPILLFGVLFHLLMGIYLEIKNRSSRSVNYASNKSVINSSWMSRNMIITGIMIMFFLALHFYDFWVPEIQYKYIDLKEEDPTRYFQELQHKFHDLWRVVLYCISFIFLSLHLLHGFQSAFQSAGFTHNKHTPTIKKLGNIYALIIPLGFIFIALFHYFSTIK